MGEKQKLLDILMDTLPEHHPWEVEIRKLRDRLIANGVTVRERGRWEDVSLRFTQVKEKCSVCGGIVYAHGFNFCPNCGADMRTKGEGEEDG